MDHPFGSVNNEQIDNNNLILLMLDSRLTFNISKQIPPFLLIFG